MRAGGGGRLICLARYRPQVKLIESKKTNYNSSAEESASGISLICGLIQSTQRNQILENGNFRVSEKLWKSNVNFNIWNISASQCLPHLRTGIALGTRLFNNMINR